jgi:hypothetical protein
MAVGYARQLLFRHPGDPLASPMVLERRAEAAKAVLDYLSALMAAKAAADGEPDPLPALILFTSPPREQRRPSLRVRTGQESSSTLRPW